MTTSNKKGRTRKEKMDDETKALCKSGAPLVSIAFWRHFRCQLQYSIRPHLAEDLRRFLQNLEVKHEPLQAVRAQYSVRRLRRRVMDTRLICHCERLG